MPFEEYDLVSSSFITGSNSRAFSTILMKSNLYAPTQAMENLNELKVPGPLAIRITNGRPFFHECPLPLSHKSLSIPDPLNNPKLKGVKEGKNNSGENLAVQSMVRLALGRYEDARLNYFAPRRKSNHLPFPLACLLPFSPQQRLPKKIPLCAVFGMLHPRPSSNPT